VNLLHWKHGTRVRCASGGLIIVSICVRLTPSFVASRVEGYGGRGCSRGAGAVAVNLASVLLCLFKGSGAMVACSAIDQSVSLGNCCVPLVTAANGFMLPDEFSVRVSSAKQLGLVFVVTV